MLTHRMSQKRPQPGSETSCNSGSEIAALLVAILLDGDRIWVGCNQRGREREALEMGF